VGVYLPGLERKYNLMYMFSPVPWIQSKEVATVLYAGISGLFFVVVGWLVSRRSPVLALVVYILYFIVNVQSGFFDDYPVRLVVPVVLLLLSLGFRHIRYLNIAASMFAAVLIATTEFEETPLVKDLAPEALWAGFFICILQDSLARLGMFEFVLVSTLYGLLVFPYLCFAYMCVNKLDSSKMVTWENFLLNKSLTWEDFAKSECLPNCGMDFALSLPGMISTLFYASTVIRNVVLGRSSFIKSAGIHLVVVGSIVGFAVADEKVDYLFLPNVTALIGALGLLFTLVLAGNNSSEDGLGVTEGNKFLTFWKLRKKSADASTGIDKKNLHENVQKQGGIPTEKQVEDLWVIFEQDQQELERARKLYDRFKKLAFQQEAIVNGFRPYDEASEKKHENEKAKAAAYAEKCREAGKKMKELDNIVKQSRTKLNELEGKIASQQKPKNE